MVVCNQDKTGREIRKRVTVTFDRNSGAVAYVFSYRSQRFGSLRPSFVRAVQQISAVVGAPREHVVTQLAGDQHQSHLVYWGSINFVPLTNDDRLNLLSGNPTGKGYLVDFQLSLRYSAEHNFPIYAMTGNPGFVLNYRVDNDGTERLASRLIAPAVFLPTFTSPSASSRPITEPEPQPETSPAKTWLRIDAKLPDAAAWIQIASRPTLEEAKSVAQQYVQLFPSTVILQSINGYFAITVGWLNKEYGRPLKDSLISRRVIPPDSFLSSGGKYQSPIWSSEGRTIQSRADLLSYALLRTTPGNAMIAGFQEQVTGLPNPNSDYLTLLEGASTSSKGLRQLPEGTLLKIRRSKDTWQQVKSLNGMTGWVSLGRPINKEEVVGPDERARRDKIIRAANIFLDDLRVYIGLHPETPDIASVSQKAFKLQSAIDSDDIPTIESTTKTLKPKMEAIPGFSGFVSSREKERKEAEIKALGEAVSLARRHERFLRDQIALNLTSPETEAFAALLSEYEAALNEPELATLTKLNERLRNIVSDRGLSDAYDQAIAGQQKPPQPPVIPSETSPNPDNGKIHLTEKNQFLLQGALTDWVLLFNASGKAPHVVRNIRGDIVFEGQQAGACVLHDPAGKIEGVDVGDMLASFNVEAAHLDSGPCPETALKSYDVLIALRDELLKQPPSYLDPLLGLVEDGTFQKLKTLTADEFQGLKDKWNIAGTKIETEIEAATRPGYGLVKVDNGSTTICMTTGDEEQAAQRELLNEQRNVLSRFFATAPEVSSTTQDAAFTAAKRGQCGAIYASRSDLWEDIQGSRRDNIHYEVVPLWFEPKQVRDRGDEIRHKQDRLAQEEEKRELQKREEAELARRRAEADTTQKEAQDAALQAQHGPQARARADEIATAIKLLAEGKETWAKSKFPELANWYFDFRRNGWEFVALDDQVSDYGTVDWKGRPLETAFANVLISMKNRILGEKKKFCWSLGIIFDAEFDMRREPFEEQGASESCPDNSEKLRRWKQRKEFRSQWVVAEWKQ